MRLKENEEGDDEIYDLVGSGNVLVLLGGAVSRIPR